MRQLFFISVLIFVSGCSRMVAERIESPVQLVHYEQQVMEQQYAQWHVVARQWCNDTLAYCIPYRDGEPVSTEAPTLSFSVTRDFGNQFSFNKTVTLEPSAVGQYTGTVILLHGYGAKKESWMNTGFYFQALGFRVIEPDLMGQGASIAPMGFGVRDGNLLAAFIDKKLTDLQAPLLLVGHSMGALAAVKTATQTAKVDGLILLAPMDRFDRATIGVAHTFKPNLSRFIPESSIRDGATLALRRAGLDVEQTDMFADLPELDIPILTYGSEQDLVSNLRYEKAWQQANITRVTNGEESHMSVIAIGRQEHEVLTHWLSDNILASRAFVSSLSPDFTNTGNAD